MWFTEDAWSPIIVCVVLAAVFFAVALTTQRAKLLWALPLLLVSAVTIFFVERVLVTDTERVEASLLELVDTFVQESQQTPKDPNPRCLRFFSARNDRDKARIAAALAFVRVEEARVTDVQINVTNQGTRAVTQFRVNGIVRVGTDGGHYPTRWEMSWQQEAGDWKVTLTRMLNAVSDQEQHIPHVDR